jgi:hypothetical protein
MPNNYGPRIVTDGLVLCLDAANPKSYPGSGTVWTDLSRNGNNGTLTNGPIFSSANGGGIFFDAANDYVAVPNSSSLNPTGAISLCAFVNLSGHSSNYGPIIFKQNNYAGSYEQYSMGIGVGGSLGLTITGVDRSQKNVSSGLDYRNTFTYVVAVASTITDDLKLYINGNLVASNTTFTSTFDISSNQVHIGAMPTVYTGFSNGRIFNTSIYNRALSITEILQNYNATKGRFKL